MKKKRRFGLWVAVVCIVALIASLAACAPEADTPTATDPDPVVETPDPDAFGVVTADQWAEIYPNEYETYQANLANSPDSDKHNYLELYPALNTMYAGYGFAKGYDEASSHLYSLKSVTSTPRINEKSLAGCITCKTPQFTATVNSEGDDVYRQNFLETVGQFTEPISCYNCHENDPSENIVGNKFFVAAMGSDVDKVPVEAQVCGQCHNEYYFADGVTTNPYTGTAQMSPDAMLAYYDEMDYKDWEHATTGAPMLKVQHPEFETIYGSEPSIMAKTGYSCANCHMGTTEADDGTEFISHEWKSPLENKELIEKDCSNCHEDLVTEVRGWQEASEARVHSISEKIQELTDLIAAGMAEGTLAGDELTQMQKAQRTSQWYWDYVMVENSEGAHNRAVANKTLDKAEAAVDEALATLKG